MPERRWHPPQQQHEQQQQQQQQQQHPPRPGVAALQFRLRRSDQEQAKAATREALMQTPTMMPGQSKQPINRIGRDRRDQLSGSAITAPDIVDVSIAVIANSLGERSGVRA